MGFQDIKFLNFNNEVAMYFFNPLDATEFSKIAENRRF